VLNGEVPFHEFIEKTEEEKLLIKKKREEKRFVFGFLDLLVHFGHFHIPPTEYSIFSYFFISFHSFPRKFSRNMQTEIDRAHTLKCASDFRWEDLISGLTDSSSRRR
jgi:hypothetical protein